MKALNKTINKEIKINNSNTKVDECKKSDSKDFKKRLIYFSPKKVNIKKGIPQSVVQRSLSISENNIAGIALKKLALFGQNKTVDLNIVKNLDKKNKKFMEILSI